MIALSNPIKSAIVLSTQSRARSHSLPNQERDRTLYPIKSAIALLTPSDIYKQESDILVSN
ncbi:MULTISPECIES: hypothetical protein [Cyanophyceae]|uniref:hypothetical protein n=1 Tax=Cyanophyceae TaxID=3028117 RepID=UPI001683A3CC|nr:hypothetical protein [Trichocoleus sp. FACHB-69]MBD1930736.1 hypothetical protein [Trichocoleus sp. FACHB-69]